MDQELLAVLKGKIEKMSCNSLRRIYPDDFEQWFDSSSERFEKYITEMIKHNLLIIKYDFYCECMNNCTAYDKKISENGYFKCEECERTYDYDYIHKNGELLYEIDKKDVLAFENRMLDYKQLVKKSKIIAFDKERNDEEMAKTETVYNTTNNITINGSVSGTAFQQGNTNSQQYMNSNSTPDYDLILQELQKISDITSKDLFDEEFGEDAEQIRELLKSAIVEANKRTEPSKLKLELEKIKEVLGKVAVEGVLLTGVKGIVDGLIKGLLFIN